MRFIKFISNQSGMSMVNVLMAAAMMGGLALVMTQLSKNSVDVQVRATNSTDINAAYNTIQQLLLNSSSCKQTFDGVIFNNTSPKVLPDIKTFFGDPPVEKSHFEVGERIGKSSKVLMQSILATKKSDNEIELKFDFNRGTVAKPNIISKYVDLKVDLVIDPADGVINSVLNCYSKADEAVETAVLMACGTLGGTLNTATNECENTLLQQQACAFETSIVYQIGGATQSCTSPVTNEILHGNIHTAKHCTDQGGTVESAGTKRVCQFSSATCPSGWTELDYWGTTSSVAQKCGTNRKGPNCANRCVSITGTSWGNNNTQSKDYWHDRKQVSVYNKCNASHWFGGTIQNVFTSRGCY